MKKSTKTRKQEKAMTKAEERRLTKRLVNKAFSLWGEVGSIRAGFKCELCGACRGEQRENGGTVILDHHHLIGRENHGLRFNPKNCITLDKWCHKFSREGAHRGTLVFNEWFRTNEARPDDYWYLIRHRDDDPIESLFDATLAVSLLCVEKSRVMVGLVCGEH